MDSVVRTSQDIWAGSLHGETEYDKICCNFSFACTLNQEMLSEDLPQAEGPAVLKVETPSQKPKQRQGAQPYVLRAEALSSLASAGARGMSQNRRNPAIQDFSYSRALKPKFVPKPGRISHVRHVSRSRPSLGFFTGGIWKRDELPARSASYCALGTLPFTGYDFPAALGSFEALKKPMPVPPVADVGLLKTCESDVGVYLSSLDNIPNSTPKFWGQRGNLNPTLDLELKLQTQSRPRVQSSGYRAFWTQHHLSLKR